ncbi:hypothetical protein [Emcibacter sp.]|uniref:hypothetical protein n=1 Tax=Emcibacter sp. TaxID=1979954 RepID=UPI002AA71EC6|nr:hypothetical protein [Emcibacter sp.]
MAGIIGNVFAFIGIVVAALIGFYSLQISAIVFVCMAYGLWLLAMCYIFLLKPSKDAEICSLMKEHEIEVFRRYWLYILFPLPAQALSAMMNLMRLAGFVWGGICLWSELYWLGGLSLAYFFKTSPL